MDKCVPLKRGGKRIRKERRLQAHIHTIYTLTRTLGQSHKFVFKIEPFCHEDKNFYTKCHLYINFLTDLSSDFFYKKYNNKNIP